MPALTDFSLDFNDPDRADVLLHLSTSIEVADISEQQPDAAASSSAVISEGKEQHPDACASVSAAVAEGKRQQPDAVASINAVVLEGKQQQPDALASVSAAVAEGKQQQPDALASVSAAASEGKQQQPDASASINAVVSEGEQQQPDAAASIRVVSAGKEQQQPDAVASSSAVQAQHRTPGCIVRTYHLHSLLLINHSHYFRGRMAKSWPQSDSRKRRREDVEGSDAAASKSAPLQAAGGSASISSSSLTEVTELVEEAELEAMHELLKLMYSQKVPSDASAELILKCLRLADRYQAMHCTDLLLAALVTKGKEMVTCSVAAQLFSMPPGLQEQAAFRDLLVTCKQAVVDQFRNVPDVIQSDELRQQFCALPFAAVLAWADSDQLQVHSENCVVYLLSAWVAAQREAGKSISAEQLKQLAHQVRVLHLGPAYQYFVLPNLEWFKGCSGMSHLPILLAYKGVNDRGVSVFPARKCSEEDSLAWEWEGPAAWVAGPRQPVSSAHHGPGSPDRTLSWKLGEEALGLLDNGEAMFSPAAVYANGLQFGCSLNTCADEGPEQSVTLDMYFDVSTKVMARHGVPWPKVATVPVGKVTFKICALAAGDERVASMRCTRSALGTQGWGIGDVLRKSAPTFQQLVAPFLIDGKLHVEMEVSGVDLLPA